MFIVYLIMHILMPWTYYQKTFWTQDLLRLLDLPIDKPQYKSAIRKTLLEKLKQFKIWKEKSTV